MDHFFLDYMYLINVNIFFYRGMTLVTDTSNKAFQLTFSLYAIKDYSVLNTCFGTSCNTTFMEFSHTSHLDWLFLCGKKVFIRDKPFSGNYHEYFAAYLSELLQTGENASTGSVRLYQLNRMTFFHYYWSIVQCVNFLLSINSNRVHRLIMIRIGLKWHHFNPFHKNALISMSKLSSWPSVRETFEIKNVTN